MGVSDLGRAQGVGSGEVLSFPGAAMIKHQNLGGLEQQKFIVSQFWMPVVQTRVLQASL